MCVLSSSCVWYDDGLGMLKCMVMLNLLVMRLFIWLCMLILMDRLGKWLRNFVIFGVSM